MAIWRQERSASGGSAESAGTAAPAAASGAAAAALDDLRRQCAVAAQERAALHTILDAKVAALVADISAGLRELPDVVSVARAVPSAQRLQGCVVDFFAGLASHNASLSARCLLFSMWKTCKRMQTYELRRLPCSASSSTLCEDDLRGRQPCLTDGSCVPSIIEWRHSTGAQRNIVSHVCTYAGGTGLTLYMKTLGVRVGTGAAATGPGGRAGAAGCCHHPCNVQWRPAQALWVKVVDVQAASACHMQTVAGDTLIHGVMQSIVCFRRLHMQEFCPCVTGAWAALLPRHPKAVTDRLPVCDSIVRSQQVVDMPGIAA
jgi:hypothetical protein